MRARTKGFIILFLLLWYISISDNLQATLIMALAFSWLGDVLLIPHNKKVFIAGGISFSLSHIMYVLTYSQDVNFDQISIWLIILLAVVYLGASCLVLKGIQKYIPKALFVTMFFYLMLNGAMNCFAFLRFFNLRSVSSLITFIGATLFFISDSALFYVRFSKENGNHFWVMLPYIISEFLIVFGLSISL